jgi:hypothetical protein
MAAWRRVSLIGLVRGGMRGRRLTRCSLGGSVCEDGGVRHRGRREVQLTTIQQGRERDLCGRL